MSIYQRKDSPIWWFSIVIPGQPRIRRSTGTTDRGEAQRIRDEAKAKAWSAPKLNGKTWGKAVMKWVEAEERSDSEILSLAKFGRHFKDRRLADITPEAVHQALVFCKTAGTYTRYRTMIAAILKLSGADVKLMVRRDKKIKSRDWITHEQWDKLYGELPAHLKPMAKFAIATGLRQANVLGLSWANVDLERRLVWIEAEDTKANTALGIPLNDDALGALRSVVGQDNQWCFTYRGQPVKDIKTAFLAACTRAGVGAYVDGSYTGFTWHGFRHTWATWHIQNGTPVEVLQKLGGWSDLRMVMRYAHHTPGHLASFAGNVRRK
jgi:integrase